jgi:glycosyltransferase involved in cell wall biosynthesis
MLSVILPTHNGAETLPLVLDAMLRLHPPEGDWELVVADDGSTDATARVVGSYSGRLPVKYVAQERRGKSAALNVALTQTGGDIVVFTDDDSIPQPEWLATYRRLADALPDYTIFGGAIQARWLEPPPRWILQDVDLAVCYSVTDAERTEGPIAPNLIWGPNMAMRASVFAEGYRFDEKVGPGKGTYAMGGETDLSLRLVAAGHRCWYSPALMVEHIVHPHQYEPRWLFARAKRFGRGMYRRQLLHSSDKPRLVFNVPRHLLRSWGEQALRAARAAFGSRHDAFVARWELNYLTGCLLAAQEHFGHAARQQRSSPTRSHAASTHR